MNGSRWTLTVKYREDQPRVAAGSPEGGRWTSGDGGVASRFGGSPVGKALEALNQDFDFVLAGSAAARLLVGDERGGDPHDLDVLELRQKREPISDRWDVRRDPRSGSDAYNVVDKETGVQVQTFEPGREVSRPVADTSFRTTFRFPYLFETDGTPNFTEVGGVKVLRPDVLLRTYRDGGRDELIFKLIVGLGLPWDYMDERWYRMEHDEATS